MIAAGFAVPCALPGCPHAVPTGAAFCGQAHYTLATQAVAGMPPVPGWTPLVGGPATGCHGGGTQVCVACQRVPACAGTMYCSYSCARAGLCVMCLAAPSYLDMATQLQTQFCSRKCRDAAPKCRRCSSRPVRFVHGAATGFCSRVCVDAKAVPPGPQPAPAPQHAAPLLRPPPPAPAPALFTLASQTDSAPIIQQFHLDWHHGNKQKPTVIHVFRVNVSLAVRARFDAYQTLVASNPGVVGKGKFAGPGNTQRRFHGTGAACGLSPSQLAPCGNAACPACSIATTGFDVGKVSRSARGHRFGAGIYFSATSSKAYDYAKVGPSGYQYIFVANVVCGKAHLPTAEWWNMASAPPTGFDSVVGKPQLITALNYDEVAVYRNDAALPTFLIMLR